MSQPERFEVDLISGSIRTGGRILGINDVRWDIPTVGAMYGVLLNYRGALEKLDPITSAPPAEPILFVKPANTWIAYGEAIPLPDEVDAIEIGAALGIVIGRTACRVAAVDALDFVAGYTIVNDVCEPHHRYEQPATRQRCRDGFCAIGPWIMPRLAVPHPQNLNLRVRVNGELRCTDTTANMIRSVATLIADVSEFVTLRAGDILHAGVPDGAPRAVAGDRVRIEVDGVGALENRVVGERDPVMRSAR